MTDILTTAQNSAEFLHWLWPDAAFDGWLTFFTQTPNGKKATAAFHRSQLVDAHIWALRQARTSHVWYGVGLRGKQPPKDKRGRAEDVIALPGVWMDLCSRQPVEKP